MGYNLRIQEFKLEPPQIIEIPDIEDISDTSRWAKLTLPEGLDEHIFKIKDGALVLGEWSFKWYSFWEENLLALAKAGWTGYVTWTGEEGEWVKAVLADSKVCVYFGEITYPEEPYKVHE